MIKFLVTAAAIIFLGLAGVTYSKAADCPRGDFTEISKTLKEQGVDVSVMTPEVKKGVVEHMGGNPPNSDDDATFIIAQKGGNGQFIVTDKEGCINFVTPPRPVPVEVIYKHLGMVEG